MTLMHSSPQTTSDGPNNGPYKGWHFRLKETLCVPQPLRTPPILIGGMGEKKTLRMVAQYAQACNMFEHSGLKTLEKKLAVLKTHCEKLERDYHSISKTVIGQTSIRDQKSADKLLHKLEQLSTLGFDTAIYAIKDPTDTKSLDLFGEYVIPRAAALG